MPIAQKISLSFLFSALLVVLSNRGPIELALDTEKAPLSVANFLAYVDSGHFEDTIFHRVIPGFMIQGGGFTLDYEQKPTLDPIKNEAANGLKNVKYSLAMARTGVVDSATAQFFINVVDNDFLDHRDTSNRGFGYAVFGKVVEGFEVVDAIAALQTGYSRCDSQVNKKARSFLESGLLSRLPLLQVLLSEFGISLHTTLTNICTLVLFFFRNSDAKDEFDNKPYH